MNSLAVVPRFRLSEHCDSVTLTFDLSPRKWYCQLHVQREIFLPSFMFFSLSFPSGFKGGNWTEERTISIPWCGPWREGDEIIIKRTAHSPGKAHWVRLDEKGVKMQRCKDVLVTFLRVTFPHCCTLRRDRTVRSLTNHAFASTCVSVCLGTTCVEKINTCWHNGRRHEQNIFVYID